MEHEHDLGSSTSRLLPGTEHEGDSASRDVVKPPSQDVAPIEPLYVHSRSELEDAFRDMLPHFEEKETEQNWTPRDKAILKLRRLTKGNGPSEYHREFMLGIKSVAEGRLSKSPIRCAPPCRTNGCQLVQELARTLGAGPWTRTSRFSFNRSLK